MTTPTEWLATRGDKRREIIKEAAEQLLAEYRSRWPSLTPIELHRLAWTLRGKIVSVKNLAGGARLIPVAGGFRVLVSDRLEAARYRTSVAHELAHTLFYTTDSEQPRRIPDLTDPQKKEEPFCFDVARHILAPYWVVESSAIRKLSDRRAIFNLLVSRGGPFQLSMPLAARVMLDDHGLANGVGGSWFQDKGKWTVKRSGSSATPGLERRHRSTLRSMAKYWLMNDVEPLGYEIIGIRFPNQTAFVLAFHAQ